MAAKQTVEIRILQPNSSESRSVRVEKEIADLITSPTLDANTKQAIINQLIRSKDGPSEQLEPREEQMQNEKKKSEHVTEKQGTPMMPENQLANQQVVKEKETDEPQPKLTSPPTSSARGNDKVHIWTEREETLLVSLRADLDDKFKSAVRHDSLWQSVVSDMAKHDVIISKTQAKDKWKNLKKAFMEFVDGRKKTGTQTRTCRHYERFSVLYGHREGTNPTVTIDSDALSSDSSGTIPETRSKPDQPTKKRKARLDRMSMQDRLFTVVSKMEDKNDELLSLMQQQHDQKMQRMDRMLDLYEKSINNNK
ncbi:uncharacterized protein [Ptychodera flava]|uniref:uncharacterized protein n=1 Tax=Ptychodera flava TaxID=63121 RepID=UPI00396AA351